MADSLPFATLLKQYRLARHLTHKDLSEASGVSGRAISNLERGTNRRPRADTVLMLADGLRLAGIERDRFLTAARGWPLPDPVPPAGPHNLPQDLPEFIGRERDIALVRTLVRQHRFVTLTGTGGCGKTRLALEAARGLLVDFTDGVHFVDLAPLRDPGLVASAIARVLEVEEIGRSSLEETLHAYLHDKRLLLVLDNFEHVLPATPLITTLLARCPAPRVLVTSRTRLQCPEETPLLVPPLDLPDRRLRLSPQVLAGYEAIALFVIRARFARQGISLPLETLPTVADICRRLDGLPLAIELTAARCAILSPTEILERLGNRLGVLTQGRRHGPARHRSLQATLDWSYGLLDPGTQTLLRRLAVFAGGATLAAIEHVCNPNQDLWPAPIDGLHDLVQQHLIRTTMGPNDETRYTLLETIREYALACLQATGEEGTVRQRHGAYFLDMAERAKAVFRTPQKVAWLDILERDHDNLRQAMRWFRDTRSAEQSLRLGAALIWFWNLHNHLAEGEQTLKAVLAGDTATLPQLRAEVLQELGHYAMYRSEFTTARAYLLESHNLFEQAGTWTQFVYSLRSLGMVACRQGDYPTAERIFRDGLKHCRERGEVPERAVFIEELGIIALTLGDYATARENLTDSLIIRRADGDQHLIALCLWDLGNAAMYQGDFLAAHAAFEEALQLHRADQFVWGIAESLDSMGRLAWYQGDYSRARQYMTEGLIMRCEPPAFAWSILESLESFAILAAVEEQPLRAACLWGAATSLHEAVNKPYSLAGKVDFDQAMMSARSMTDEATWQSAWERGRALSLEAAVALALALPLPTDQAILVNSAKLPLRPAPTVLSLVDTGVEVGQATKRTSSTLDMQGTQSRETLDSVDEGSLPSVSPSAR